MRVATAADVARVVDLREAMFRDMGVDCTDESWKAPCRDWFAARIDDPAHRIVVVEEVDDGAGDPRPAGGRVVACVIGSLRDSAPVPGLAGHGDVLVSTVSTDASARGRGHARAALEVVLDWARESGVARAELMTSPDGRALYEALGFRVTTFPAMRMTLA